MLNEYVELDNNTDLKERLMHMYWVMLRSMESNIEDPKKDIFGRMDVEAGYKLLWELNPNTKHLKPHWIEHGIIDWHQSPFEKPKET